MKYLIYRYTPPLSFSFSKVFILLIIEYLLLPFFVLRQKKPVYKLDYILATIKIIVKNHEGLIFLFLLFFYRFRNIIIVTPTFFTYSRSSRNQNSMTFLYFNPKTRESSDRSRYYITILIQGNVLENYPKLPYYISIGNYLTIV